MNPFGTSEGKLIENIRCFQVEYVEGALDTRRSFSGVHGVDTVVSYTLPDGTSTRERFNKGYYCYLRHRCRSSLFSTQRHIRGTRPGWAKAPRPVC